MKYVMIILNSVEKRYLYSGFNDLSNGITLFIPDYYRKIAKALFRIHLSEKKVVYSCLSSIFNKYIYKPLDKKGWNINTSEICFIVYGRDYECYRDNILRYLDELFPGNKKAIYFDDLITSFKVNINYVKKIFDVVISFDQGEASKYKIEWAIEPFNGDMLKKVDKNLSLKWDVTFVGNAKNRYKRILDLYVKLKERGFSCDFYITNVKKKDRMYEKEIHYEHLPFEEMLQHVIQSRCVAEIVQDNGTSPTTRFSEAVLLGRNLLTDAVCFKNVSENPENVIYFESLENINFERIKKETPIDKDYYMDLLSVKSIIEVITKRLKG